MPLTIYNDTAMHEAGHCLLSYLAQDLFVINFVTTDAILSRTQDANSKGGLGGKVKKDVKTLSFEDHDLMVLTCLAGMAADDVNHCNGLLDEQLYDNKIFVQKMQSTKYKGDLDLLIPHLNKLSTELNIDQRSYTISCQKLLHNIFVDSTVKPILIGLRNEIENSRYKKLNGEEIIRFLDNTELRNWKDNKWKELINKRMSKIKRKYHTNSIIKFVCVWFNSFWGNWGNR